MCEVVFCCASLVVHIDVDAQPVMPLVPKLSRAASKVSFRGGMLSYLQFNAPVIQTPNLCYSIERTVRHKT